MVLANNLFQLALSDLPSPYLSGDYLAAACRLFNDEYTHIVSFLPKKPTMPFLRRTSMRGLLALLTTVGSC